MKELHSSKRARSFVAIMAYVLTGMPRVTVLQFWAAAKAVRVKHGLYVPRRWPRAVGRQRDAGVTAAAIEEQPAALTWVLSRRFCLAPAKWPASMRGAFRHRLIPSPYSFGGILLRGHVPYIKADQTYLDYIYLRLYCYGMSPKLIAQHFEVGEASIYEGMFRAMSRMYEKPAFVVWATATNFRKARILPQMWHACADSSPGGRGKFLKALQTDIFSLGPDTLSSWVNSPLILSYLIYSTPKQPRDGIYPSDPFLGSTHR